MGHCDPNPRRLCRREDQFCTTPRCNRKRTDSGTAGRDCNGEDASNADDQGSRSNKVWNLVADLSNRFVKGKDEYPEDMTLVATMLELYEPPVNHRPPRHGTTNGGSTASAEASTMFFVQNAGERSPLTYKQRVAASVAGMDGILHPAFRATEDAAVTGITRTNALEHPRLAVQRRVRPL
jgi:hypothetical protein